MRILGGDKDVGKSGVKMSNGWDVVGVGLGSGLRRMVRGRMGWVGGIGLWYVMTFLGWEV